MAVPDITQEIKTNIKHLRLLAKQYPNIQNVCTEIINLRAILNLPKGTEHFLSDLHGEYEAFTHIINNCSGVIRDRTHDVFGDSITEDQRNELCTLIYYPREKLEQIKEHVEDLPAWYEAALLSMIELCKSVACKYTRSKVRKAMPPEFAYIIDELLHADYVEANQSLYYQKIMESILALEIADEFIVALASVIKRLAVDRLHIVGDIFDRGPRADLIMDMLMDHHSVDIQWGNHDILWMGAAAGHDACIAGVVTNSAAHGNLGTLEQGYGINLRPLAIFAEKTYTYSEAFDRLKKNPSFTQEARELNAKMYKAIAVIMFKLEAHLILRHPEYDMDRRMLLDKINYQEGTVNRYGVIYPLTDTHLPTVDPSDPYRLTPEELKVVEGLRDSFVHAERLQRHIGFLYSHGELYKCFNHNLLYHGCIPTNADGSFTAVDLCGKRTSGKALMEHAEHVARVAYFGSGKEKQDAMDAFWYLWCGKSSPLYGRDQMTTFERRFIKEAEAWAEAKDPYFDFINDEAFCIRILNEFGLDSEISHIINGHVPVKASKGESPIKGNGRLIVIDGGFCKAYQPTTGIAGYTLIYNSYGLRLSAHMPFESIQKAVEENMDIHSSTNVFETMRQRMRVIDSDIGQELSEQIYDLSLLREAYKSGIL